MKRFASAACLIGIWQAAAGAAAAAGYLLVIPAPPRAAGTDTLAYLDVERPAMTRIATLRGIATTDWVRAEPERRRLIWAGADEAYAAGVLRVIDLDKDVRVRQHDWPGMDLARGWTQAGDGGADEIVLLTERIDKPDQTAWKAVAPATWKTRDLEAEDVDVRVCPGRRPGAIPTGGPEIHYAPSKGFRLHSVEPPGSFPLSPAPPEGLFADRPGDAWDLVGDRAGDFGLVERCVPGRSTSCRLMLFRRVEGTFGRWSRLQFRGTGSFAFLHGPYLVFQEAAPDTGAADPAKRARAAPVATGSVRVVCLGTGEVLELRLSRGAEVLSVGRTSVLAREGDVLVLVRYEGAKVVSQRPVVRGEAVLLTRYALPASAQPKVVVEGEVSNPATSGLEPRPRDRLVRPFGCGRGRASLPGRRLTW